jgi:uncharacterized MAPEG superfamily protein
VAPSLIALLGFAAWTVLLVLVSLTYRTGVVLVGRRRANSWPRGEPPPEGEPHLMVRVRDAHLNCAENLPVFAAIVAVAAASDHLPAIDPVAPYLLAARIAQSLTHLAGTSHWHVFARASFFSVQLGVYAFMILALL